MRSLPSDSQMLYSNVRIRLDMSNQKRCSVAPSEEEEPTDYRRLQKRTRMECLLRLNSYFLEPKGLHVSLRQELGELRGMTCESFFSPLLEVPGERTLGYLVLRRGREKLAALMMYQQASPFERFAMFHACTEASHRRKGYHGILASVFVLFVRCLGSFDYVGAEANASTASAVSKLGFRPARLRLGINWKEISQAPPEVKRQVLGEGLLSRLERYDAYPAARRLKARNRIQDLTMDKLFSYGPAHTSGASRWIEAHQGSVSDISGSANMLSELDADLAERAEALLEAYLNHPKLMRGR